MGFFSRARRLWKLSAVEESESVKEESTWDLIEKESPILNPVDRTKVFIQRIKTDPIKAITEENNDN